MTRNAWWMIGVLMLVLSPLVFGMEVVVVNATQMTDGSPIPTDEGPLGVEVYWKLKMGPEDSWQLWKVVAQQPPFPVEAILREEGYPAKEKEEIEVKARHTLGTRVKSEFNAPQTFTIPVNNNVGCLSPKIKSIK